MRFLDGFKTIIGAVGMVVVTVFPKVAPAVVTGAVEAVTTIATGAFGLLTVLGVIHKVEKAKDAEIRSALRR